MKNYALLRREKKLSPKWVLQNAVKSRSKYYPLKGNNESEFNPLVLAFLLCLPLSSLAGCMGIYEGGFECPAGIGVGCKSISDVNTMVNQGEVPKFSAEQSTARESDIWYAPGSSIQKEMPSNSAKTCPCTMERRKGALSFDEKSI